MIELIAHITTTEVPSLWMAGLVGFVAGVGATCAVMLRKAK